MSPVPIFWLIALLLVAATVAALVWPLLRGRGARPAVDDDAATGIYRDQKRQLDDELAAGAISRAERDAQLDEIAARLSTELDAAAIAARPAGASPRASFIAALLIVAVIPASAMLLYGAFGSPASLRVAAADERPAMSREQVVAMVDKLAARMKEHPEDPTGWRLLARAYAAMGRFTEAVAAYREAAARSPEDATLLADWADALAMEKRTLQGEPSQLIARALALEPNHPKALSLAGTAAVERKDYATAIAEWRKLKAQFPPEGEEAKGIDTMIAEVEAAQRGAPASSAGSAAGAGGASIAGGAASEASSGSAAAAAASAITGRVSLDPKLRERAGPGDALFVFARAINGPRMPLAVLRTTAGELPRDFKLDDSMAMTPAARLSTAGEVVVEARISKSGGATPSPGDLQGSSAPVRPGTHGVLIVINDVVP